MSATHNEIRNRKFQITICPCVLQTNGTPFVLTVAAEHYRESGSVDDVPDEVDQLLPDVFDDVTVYCEHKYKNSRFDEVNRASWKQCFFAALHDGKQVEPMRKVLAALVIMKKSTCNIERELFASAQCWKASGKALSHEALYGFTVVKKYCRNDTSLIEIAPGVASQFCIALSQRWEEFHGRRFGVTSVDPEKAKLCKAGKVSDNTTVKEVRTAQLAQVFGILQKSLENRSAEGHCLSAETSIADLKTIRGAGASNS